jgi:arsenate reductase
MNEVIICHNPNCGALRNTLRISRNAGIEPTVIDAEGKHV